MVNGYLLDTNSVIDYLDNKLPLKANKLIEEINWKISVITRMELLSWPGASEGQIYILNEFIIASNVFGLLEPIILKTIDVRKTYKTKLPDAIISATCLVNDLTLITRNVKDFQIIDGLKLINPYYL